MNKRDKIVTAVCIVLTALGLYGTLNESIQLGRSMSIVHTVLLCAVVMYAVIAYNKPHGNLLKYLIILFAVTLLIKESNMLPEGIGIGADTIRKEREYIENALVVRQLPHTIDLVCLMLIMYIAGRLNKIKENAVLMTVVLVLLVFTSIRSVVNGYISGFSRIVAQFGPVIAWLDICFAYFLRYKEHKEAGNADVSQA